VLLWMMKVFDLMDESDFCPTSIVQFKYKCYCFHLDKYLIPWMKVSVLIINLSIVHTCFNIAQQKLH
jgi:hypothetical protein